MGRKIRNKDELSKEKLREVNGVAQCQGCTDGEKLPCPSGRLHPSVAKTRLSGQPDPSLTPPLRLNFSNASFSHLGLLAELSEIKPMVGFPHSPGPSYVGPQCWAIGEAQMW